MSTEPEVPTVFEVMKRAVEVCDPEGAYPETADLLARFEGRDEPVTALANPDLEITEAAAIDEGVAEPVEIMAVAVSTYLAHRRDEIDDEREDPRDPPDPDERPFGEQPHPQGSPTSTSQPHPSQDPEAEPWEGPKRDKVDE